MTRIILAIVTVFVLPLTVCADYIPTNFVDLAGTSEAIVVGTITKVDEENFALKVEDSIVGAVKMGETIPVKRFHDWPCAWRWAPYEVGQKVFVFLNFNNDDMRWVIRGAGCEGESPIVENEVHANFGVPGRFVESDGSSNLLAVGYDQLRTAILDFRATFRLTPAKNPWRKDGKYSVYVAFDRIERITRITTQPAKEIGPRRPRPPQRITRQPPREFRSRSPIHRYLAELVDEERARIEKYKNAENSRRRGKETRGK